jgi:hypothetical protein
MNIPNIPSTASVALLCAVMDVFMGLPFLAGSSSMRPIYASSNNCPRFSFGASAPSFRQRRRSVKARRFNELVFDH